jgi:Domain of unknown function (DUF4062)
MGYNARVLRVLISSPSDLTAERRVAEDVVQAWNTINSARLRIHLMPVLWEKPSTPAMGNAPQDILNEQIVDNSDILIGMFATRIGTKTANAESGSVEEIERAIEAGRPVMVYFSTEPVNPESIDLDQMARLRKLKSDYEQRGIIGSFDTDPELREKLTRHLSSTVDRYFVEAEDDRPAKSPKEKSKPSQQLETEQQTVQATVQPASALPVANAHVAAPSDLAQILEQMLITYRRSDEIWTAERHSKPLTLDRGKEILRQLALGMREFRPLLSALVSMELNKALDHFENDVRAAQRHESAFNGTDSYRTFWITYAEALDDLHRAIIDAPLAKPPGAKPPTDLAPPITAADGPLLSCIVKSERRDKSWVLIAELKNTGPGIAYSPRLNLGSFGVQSLPDLGPGQWTRYETSYGEGPFAQETAPNVSVGVMYEDMLGRVFRQDGELKCDTPGMWCIYSMSTLGEARRYEPTGEVDTAFYIQPILHLAIDTGSIGPSGSYLTVKLSNVGRGIARNIRIALPGFETIYVGKPVQRNDTVMLPHIRYDDKPFYTGKLPYSDVLVQFEDEIGNPYVQRGNIKHGRSAGGILKTYRLDGLGPASRLNGSAADAN